VDVYGAAGHMGSIRERDGAITKTAHLVRSLIFSKEKLESLGGRMRLVLGTDGISTRSDSVLVLEGGQGFVPTHGIDEIMSRLRQAAERGAENYLRRLGRTEGGEEVIQMTYEKLHNVAFDGDPASPAMSQASAAAKICGLWKDEPVLGWTVSCDARLFATEYLACSVLTFGPGQLIPRAFRPGAISILRNSERGGNSSDLSSLYKPATLKTNLRLGVIGAGAVVREIYQ